MNPALYVHVPFCQRKCYYCAFYSEALLATPLEHDGAKKQIPNYLQALETEISLRKKDAPQGVSSLFIGGGTPTVLSANQLASLMQLIHSQFRLAENAEQTIEGNPGTLSVEKLEVLIHSGINRFSLGVQAFNDTLLRQIGRIHTVSQVRDSIRAIRAVGFANLNLDLMFGLPGQSLADWQETIEEALSFHPEHLSLYGLILEEGTPLGERYLKQNLSEISKISEMTPALPDDDLQAEMYTWARQRLQQAGYGHYETSNFALAGRECQHNISYWHGRDYLGLGPGAVSAIDGIRIKNLANLVQYMKRLNKGQEPEDYAEHEVLTDRERMAERMFLGLRISQGVSLESFRHDFGLALTDIYAQVLERYLSMGVLILEDGYLRLKPEYWFVANQVLQEFV